jgi:hypothetical protein
MRKNNKTIRQIHEIGLRKNLVKECVLEILKRTSNVKQRNTDFKNNLKNYGEIPVKFDANVQTLNTFFSDKKHVPVSKIMHDFKKIKHKNCGDENYIRYLNTKIDNINRLDNNFI